MRAGAGSARLRRPVLGARCPPSVPGGAEAPLASARLRARGVAQPGLSVNEWTLTLPAGTYYWSVQAIDTGLAGGAWATEQSETVP